MLLEEKTNQVPPFLAVTPGSLRSPSGPRAHTHSCLWRTRFLSASTGLLPHTIPLAGSHTHSLGTERARCAWGQVTAPRRRAPSPQPVVIQQGWAGMRPSHPGGTGRAVSWTINPTRAHKARSLCPHLLVPRACGPVK